MKKDENIFLENGDEIYALDLTEEELREAETFPPDLLPPDKIAHPRGEGREREIPDPTADTRTVLFLKNGDVLRGLLGENANGGEVTLHSAERYADGRRVDLPRVAIRTDEIEAFGYTLKERKQVKERLSWELTTLPRGLKDFRIRRKKKI